MKKVLTAVMVVAALATSGAVSEAGLFGCGTFGCGPVRGCNYGPVCGPVCRPAPACVTYETKEVTCTKTVYDTEWREMTVQCVRYEQHTDWVEKSYTECVPHVEHVTKQVPYTVCTPYYETVEKTYTRYRSVPVTTQQTCVVDEGHWDVQYCAGGCNHGPRPRRRPRCGGCGGCYTCCAPAPPCCGHRVWVPNLVEKTYPCTKYVCEPYTETVPVKVCRYKYEQHTREVTYPVCTYEYVQKTCKVPVTRCVAVPYEVTKKVPYCVPRQVEYTMTVCTPVCQPACTSCY